MREMFRIFFAFSVGTLLLLLLVLPGLALLLVVCPYLADSIASNVPLIDFSVAVTVLKVISTYSKFDYLLVLISPRTH